MLLSLVIYTLVGVVLFVLGWHYNRRFALPGEHHTTKEFLLSWEMIASFALFAVISGVRYHTGWDHEYYIQDYVQYQNEGTCIRSDFEPGFRLLVTIFAKLGLHYSLFFGFLGLVNIFFIYFALRKHREVIPWVGLLIMMGPYYLHLMNSMRQGVVECVLVSVVVLVTERKYALFAIFSLLLVTVHKVALLIIPVVLLAKLLEKIEDNKKVLAVYLYCFLIGQFPSAISCSINLFSGFLSAIGYQKYVNLFNTNPLYAFHRCSIGAVSVALLTVHLFLIYYYSKMREYYADNKFFKITLALAFIYICYFVLVMNTAFYFKRPAELLLPFMVISSGFLMVFLLKTKRIVPLIIFCVVSCSIAAIMVFKNFYYGVPDTSDFYHFIPM